MTDIILAQEQARVEMLREMVTFPLHKVQLRESDYGLQHPLACRPNLLGCPVETALRNLGGPPIGQDGEQIIGTRLIAITNADPVELTIGDEVPDDYDPLLGHLLEKWPELEAALAAPAPAPLRVVPTEEEPTDG